MPGPGWCWSSWGARWALLVVLVQMLVLVLVLVQMLVLVLVHLC